MNVEFLEFYPTKLTKKELEGTLRIRLPDRGNIHILGVFIRRTSEPGASATTYWVRLPTMIGIDKATGNKCRYPCVSFDDQDDTRKLITECQTRGGLYIEEWILDHGDAVSAQQAVSKEVKIETPAMNDPMSNMKARSILSKQWVDPPKRKIENNQRYKYGQ